MCRSVGLAVIAVVTIGLPSPASASLLSPPPVLSPPATTAAWGINGGVADSCNTTGANCYLLQGNFDYDPIFDPGVYLYSFLASGLFMPNLAVPTYVNPSASASVSGTINLPSVSAAATVSYNFEVFDPTQTALRRNLRNARQAWIWREA